MTEGKWAEDWNQAKRNFEARTGAKKPSAKTMLGFKKQSGLEGGLKSIDATFMAIKKETDVKKKGQLVDKFAAEIKSFDAKVAAYVKVLVAVIETADKAKVKPELDVLEKQLHALSAILKSFLKGEEAALLGLKGRESLARNMMTNLAGGVAKAKLFIAKVKATKSAQVFNDGIKSAARDITQSMGNVEKLKGMHYEFPKGNPTKLLLVMEPWAQEKRKLPITADATLVLREIGAFAQMITAVERWLQT